MVTTIAKNAQTPARVISDNDDLTALIEKSQAEVDANLERTGQKHPDQVMRGILKERGLGWCNKLHQLMPLSEFDPAENRLGYKTVSRRADAPAASVDYRPPADMTGPEELADFAQSKWDEAKASGAKNVPTRLTKYFRENHGDAVGYCGSCRRFHPKYEATRDEKIA